MKYLSFLSIALGIYTTSACMEEKARSLIIDNDTPGRIIECQGATAKFHHFLDIYNHTNSTIKARFEGAGEKRGGLTPQPYYLKDKAIINPQEKHTFEIAIGTMALPAQHNIFKMSILTIRPVNDKNNRVIFYKPLKCHLNTFIVKEVNIHQSLLMIENTNK